MARSQTLYSDVLQLVAHREKLKLELRALCQVIGSEEPLRGATKVRSLLTALRNATFSIVHSVEAWSQSQHVDAVSFEWQGRDYLATMCNDLDFVADSPGLVASVAAPANLLRSNPLMLPRTIEQACSQPEDIANASLPAGSEGERLRHAEALLIEAKRRSQLSRSEHPTTALSDWTERARAQLAELRNGPIALESEHAFSLRTTNSFFGNKTRKSARMSPVETYGWTRRRRKRHLPSNHRLKQRLEQLQHTAGPPLLPPVARVSPSCSRLAELARPRAMEKSAETQNLKRKPRIRRRNRSPAAFGNPHVRLCAEDLFVLGRVDKQPSDAAARIGAAVLILLAKGAHVPEDVAWPQIVSQLASSREAADAACTRLHAVEPRQVPLFKARTLAKLLQKIDIGDRFTVNNISVQHFSPEALMDGEATHDREFADTLFRLADWAWGVINSSQEYHAGRGAARVEVDERSSTLGRILHTAWWRFHDGEGPACLVTIIAPAIGGDNIRDNMEDRLIVKAYDPAASAEARLTLDTTSVNKLRGHIPVRTFVKADLLSRLELVTSAGRVKLRIRNGSPAGCAVPAPGQRTKNMAIVSERIAKCNEPSIVSDFVASRGVIVQPTGGEAKMDSMHQKKTTPPLEIEEQSSSLSRQSFPACSQQQLRRKPNEERAYSNKLGFTRDDSDGQKNGPAPALEFAPGEPIRTDAHRAESDMRATSSILNLTTPGYEDIPDCGEVIRDATTLEAKKDKIKAPHAPKVVRATAVVAEPHNPIEDAVDSVQRAETTDCTSRVNEQVSNNEEYDEDFLDDDDDSRKNELHYDNLTSNAGETDQLRINATSRSRQSCASAFTDPSEVHGTVQSARLQGEPQHPFEVAPTQNLVEAHSHILDTSSNQEHMPEARDAAGLEFKLYGSDLNSIRAYTEANIDSDTGKEEGNAGDDDYNDDFEAEEN